MVTASELETTLCAFENASDIGALTDVLEQSAVELGFANVAYVAVRLRPFSDNHYAITNYPDDWQVHYSQNAYADVDPVIAAADRGIRPVPWGSNLPDCRYGTNEQRVFDEASSFGLMNGITVPVHKRGSEFATLNLASDMTAKEFQGVWHVHRHKLHLMAMYFHEAVVDRLAAVDDNRIELSPRERECLLWTARGKTAWEISEILGVAESTAVFHLNNAARKLGTYGKHHAVVKAIMSGLIVP